MTPMRGGSAPGLPEAAVVGDEHAVQRGGERGRLASSECTGARSGLGGGDDERTDALARPGRRRRSRPSRASAKHPELGAVQDPATLGALGGHGHIAQRPPRGWSASATVPVTAPEATCDRKRWRCSGVPTSRTIGANWVTVASRGPGRDGPAQLLDDDGRLDEGQPEATVLLGDGQGGPIERHHGAPELLGRLTRLDDRADDFEGALLLEERSDRGTQLLLLGRELELHRPPFPA